ncbi:MAG: Chitinase (EC [uncultured Sulfurovum sp.]|uniref:Chitinase (EC) n=1 Tax=uncultured Sulfurovum sp. TaxID=269237 RepID=A0A6S6TVL5_9BACT|nr:MAG: Chitinase (EC [uncultured Sulfurovum sp.]
MQKIFRLILLFTTFLSLHLQANFNFSNCSGSGTFEQQIVHYDGDYENAATVGTIPEGIEGLRIELVSDKDVDIRLYGENDDKIVHWPYGLHYEFMQTKKPYNDVNVTYSGYNGVNGKKGHEFIEVDGTTPTSMTMKAFGYQAGYAVVNYSWSGKVGCTESNTSGTGSFTQTLEQNVTSLVGTIPPDVDNVKINLSSDTDLDIQLYGADGTAIASWKPTGLLSGPTKQSLMYKDMNITWSGYNGVNGEEGHEYITITPKTTEMLVMKVYGYEAGTADVRYSWGNDTTSTLDYAIILAYAEDSSNTLPSIQNYLNIGISNVTITPNNIQEVNDAIANSNVEDIDTFTELLAVFASTSACLSREALDVMIDNEENLTEVNTECITDMSELFKGNFSFNQNINNWDVSNVIDMSEMFLHAVSFNQDIGDWIVSNVTDMSSMFAAYGGDGINPFNHNISNWDVSNVTDMSSMFAYAVAFNQNIGNWNVSNVINMQKMFIGARNFNQYIGAWDVSNVINMSQMFSIHPQDKVSSYNQDMGDWNVSNVTDMSQMFQGSFTFNQNIVNWDVSNVTDMRNMFANTRDFNQYVGGWNVSNVTDMARMFAYADNFNQNISNWNVSNVIYYYKFSIDSPLTVINTPHFD